MRRCLACLLITSVVVPAGMAASRSVPAQKRADITHRLVLLNKALPASERRVSSCYETTFFGRYKATMSCFSNATAGVARQLQGIIDLMVGVAGRETFCAIDWDGFRAEIAMYLRLRLRAVKPPYSVNTAFGRGLNDVGRRTARGLPPLLSRC